MIAISGCNRPETYTVIFNSNGGTGTMADQTFTEDEAQALTRNTFTYEGYTFTGWNTVQGGSGTSYTDGQTITVTADMTLYAQWTVPQRHEYVDLGLPSGTLWATCNVGANAPEEFGDYFAWGETAPKEFYDWSSYKYCNGSENTLTKYCYDAHFGYNGFTDTLNTLEATDDAATANWGAGWRMPTVDEMRELIDNCTIIWITQNDVNGRVFTGSNGNSIFLPAAGCRFDDVSSTDYAGIYGLYRSSSLYPRGAFDAWGIAFSSQNDDCGIDNDCYRYAGLSVRPVCSSLN